MITQIRLEHDVNIQFPDKDDGNQVRASIGARLGQRRLLTFAVTWEQ